MMMMMMMRMRMMMMMMTPLDAVELGGYSVWWITIIKYNLKGGGAAYGQTKA